MLYQMTYFKRSNFESLSSFSESAYFRRNSKSRDTLSRFRGLHRILIPLALLLIIEPSENKSLRNNSRVVPGGFKVQTRVAALTSTCPRRNSTPANTETPRLTNISARIEKNTLKIGLPVVPGRVFRVFFIHLKPGFPMAISDSASEASTADLLTPSPELLRAFSGFIKFPKPL